MPLDSLKHHGDYRMTIIKRTDVGRPLTWDELDDNFRQVDDLTAAASAAVSSASVSATAAAGSAVASANSATDAANSAANAAQSAAQAEEYANNASDYAQNKFTFYKTSSDPDGTIAGLAATTDGQSFWVAQGPDALSAAWQYQNNAGVAVLQAKQPGTAAITGTIREFTTLAAAQADADAGNIPVGSTAYYRSPDAAELAVEVINNAGTLVPTGRKMLATAAVENLLPLNETTKFKTVDEGEYEFGLKFDTVTVDSINNVLYYISEGKLYNLLNSLFNYINTKILLVDGVEVDPAGILDVSDKDNVESLGETTTFSTLDNEGEYEFGPQYDTVTLDSQGNVMWFSKGRQLYSLLAGNFPELFINGIEMDPAGILPAGDKTNLTALSETTNYTSGGDEFEFNQKPYVLTDEQKNILFDVLDYINRSVNWDIAYERTQNIQPQKINPLLPWSDVDSGGKFQVFVLDNEVGEQIQVTDGTSNETNPRPDALDRIVWQSDQADPPPGGLFYAQLPEFTPHAYIARKKIVGWGHSFINNGAFFNRLRALTNLPLYNFGLAGQTSDAIAARQGGAPAYYAPVGGSIPASGTVTLTPALPGPCRSLAAPVALKSNLAGVDGVFTWDGTNAVFTRDAAGSVVPVSVQTPLFVYPITTVNVSGSISSGTQFDLHDECINIFWIGRNNLSQTDLIMENLISMVEYVKNIGQKIVILAEFNSSGEPTGSTGFNQMTELNRRYKEKYPEFYCEINGVDILQNFINNANPNSPDDMSDVAAGLTPRSLRYDNLHPSQQISGNGGSLTPEFALDYGANVNANFVYQFLMNKGWL
ncbi:hypothetical protein [Pectobacterium phage PEAT2]|uniref:SGNH hydrolase-type esterase domain-containing protein n=1 Tax=Pectobacterium phage PEAT2 TaxID=2053078 RepID=A0A2H4N7A3_9CAUD|nr:hypothetical protein F8206_gp54 [Pectobacterium phage PEAT2]ATV25065.1 hypothetical protein [Pectobacterium phage PEAT2]